MKQIVMGILFLLFLNGCTASKISNVKFNTTKSQQSYLLEDGRTKLDVIFELEGNQVIIKKVAPSISKRTLNQYDNRNTACMTISYNKSNNTRYLNPCDISKNNEMFFKKKMRKTKGWITYPHALFAIAINTLLVPLEVISGEHPYSSFVVYDTHDISSIIELGVKLDDMLVDYSSRVNIPIEPPYISKSKTSFWGNLFKVWAYTSIAATTINTLTDNGIVKAIAEGQAIRAGEKEKYKSAPDDAFSIVRDMRDSVHKSVIIKCLKLQEKFTINFDPKSGKPPYRRLQYLLNLNPERFYTLDAAARDTCKRATW